MPLACWHESFILKLMDVNEVLAFNYNDLKAGYTEVCKTYPDLKDSFPLDMKGGLAGKLAVATMAMLTHVRRLKDEVRLLKPPGACLIGNCRPFKGSG